MVVGVTREGAGGVRADRGTVDVAGALRAASPTGVGIVVGGARGATGVVPVCAGDRAGGADARRSDSCSARPGPTDLTAHPTAGGGSARPGPTDLAAHPTAGSLSARSRPTDLTANPAGAATRPRDRNIRPAASGVWHPGTATAATAAAAGSAATRGAPESIRLGRRGVGHAGIAAATTPTAACGSTRASRSAVGPSHAAACIRIATSSVSAARAHPCIQLWIQTTRRRRGD